MIIVTGATGALNGATVAHLLERMPASEIVVVARNTAKAQRFAGLGVAVRHGDYAEPDSLRGAFDGADQLLLVSSSDPTADHASLHRAAITAATEVDVGRILYTSHQGASVDTPFGPGRSHAATEQALAESGIPWTSLRNGYYAHALDFLTNWRTTGAITVPLDGPVSWTAREDAAEAAAVIIATGHGYDGPVTLTANAAPTFADIASIASEVSGRAIGIEVIGESRWMADQVAAGTPEQVAGFILGMYQAADQGFFAGVDPLLGTLLEREPKTVRDLLERPASGH